MAIPQAIVQNIEGEVSVTRNGEVVNIKAGDALLPGDVVETGSSGRLSLSFPGEGNQTPAEGVMSPNGKITLGEQATASGQQLVVLEDTECFEFTTEPTEESAAVEGNAAGLFGSGLMDGAGSLGAAAGAVAAGLFVGSGSGGGGGDSGDAATANGSRPSVSSDTFVEQIDSSEAGEPETPEEFVEQNANPETVQVNLVEPVVQAGEATQADPNTLPDNAATAGNTVAANLGDKANDALSATTGSGSPTGDVADAVVDGINQTPLGEPLSPVTDPIAELGDQELGIEQLGTVDDGLITQLVQTADGAVNVTPVGDGLDPVFEPLTEAAQTIDNTLLDGVTSLKAALSGESGGGDQLSLDGIGDALAGTPLEGVTEQLTGGFEDAIAGTPLEGGAEQLAAALQGGGASAGGTPLDGIADQISSGLEGAIDGTPLAGLGDELSPEGAEGLLGSVENLAAQLPSTGGESGPGDLLSSTASSIQSTAADAASSLPTDGIDPNSLG